jgi:hypothetical protein
MVPPGEILVIYSDIRPPYSSLCVSPPQECVYVRARVCMCAYCIAMLKFLSPSNGCVCGVHCCQVPARSPGQSDQKSWAAEGNIAKHLDLKKFLADVTFYTTQ